MKFSIRFAALALLGFCSGISSASAATTAVVFRTGYLRAGPDLVYPAVISVNAGGPVVVYGCLLDYTWCDVSWGTYRGWIAAPYVRVAYVGGPVVLTADVAPRMNIAVVGFDHEYWRVHYTAMPWYGRWTAYYRPLPSPRAHGAVVCGPNGCAGRVVRTGPNGRVVVHGRVDRD